MMTPDNLDALDAYEAEQAREKRMKRRRAAAWRAAEAEVDDWLLQRRLEEDYERREG